MRLTKKDLLGIQDLSVDEINLILDTAESFIEVSTREIKKVPTLRGKTIINLFMEPSTRTRTSFEIAGKRLGADTVNISATTSSVVKGETLIDMARNLEAMNPDVIVIRHNASGAPHMLAKLVKQSIINAGDGAHEHPTQALLDLYTIRKEIGAIDGLKIAMVGDLAQGRTVRSLTYLLSKYQGIKIYFVAPTLLKMKEDILEHLREHNIWYQEETDLDKVLPEVDVVYQTRIQKERFGDRISDYEKCRGVYVINSHTLGLMKEKAIVMHPLPRLDEISMEVDKDPRAAYFRQAQNGLYVRMALLSMVFS